MLLYGRKYQTERSDRKMEDPPRENSRKRGLVFFFSGPDYVVRTRKVNTTGF